MLNLKSWLFLVFIISILSSCKHGASRIDINDIESHRSYQDSLIVLGKTPSSQFLILKKLITEYRNIKYEDKDNNPNYNYYLARLYSYINFLPMTGIFYDSVNNKLINVETYKNFYDSSYYYCELTLKYNPNHIRAMSNFASSLFNESQRYNTYKEKKLELPFSGIRDPIKSNERLNYMYNNFSKFIDSDTSSNKQVVGGIIEHIYPFFSQTLLGLVKKGIDWNSDDQINAFSYVGKCINFLKSSKLQILDQEYFNNNSKELLPFVVKANDKIKLGPIRKYLDRNLYESGWSSTEHSLDGDIETSKGNIVEYNSSVTFENGIAFILNSDYTYRMDFKPPRYQKVVSVSGTWKFIDNNYLEFDKDIFVSIPVTSADFPISEEQFYEYYLIPKKVQIYNGYLVLDKRSTNRNTFFVQLAIAQQTGNINADSYAYKSLSELSLDKGLVTQYLGYYK